MQFVDWAVDIDEGRCLNMSKQEVNTHRIIPTLKSYHPLQMSVVGILSHGTEKVPVRDEGKRRDSTSRLPSKHVATPTGF